MTDAEDAPRDDRSQYEQARAEFVASVGQRVEALREALALLVQRPQSIRRRDNLLRRVHAVAAAARVLGFDAAAQALSELESQLRPQKGGVGPEQLAAVATCLDRLPALARTPASDLPAAGEPSTPPSRPLSGGVPLDPQHQLAPSSVLVFGKESLADALRGDSPSRLEVARAEDLPTARDLAQAVAPDVVLVDVDLRGGPEFVQGLLGGALLESAPVIVVGTFDRADAVSAYVGLGAARVLSKPVTPESLSASLARISSRPRFAIERQPLGDLSMPELSERIASEINRGLVEALEWGCEQRTAPLGDGTDVLAAVWGAVARIRELVTVRSQGAVRFDDRGPEGAVTIAPWLGRERAAAERGDRVARSAEPVPLGGRRAVVVDDDPAVVWFISGLLSSVGMEVLEAHDGRRAFEMTCTTWPDVVVSDVLMPERDGFTLCRDIKRDVAVSDVPVILLSWKEDLLRRVRELGANADGYLHKDASASAVVQRVREVLRPRSRVERRLAHGGEVQGRLDGMTARLLLQLVCAHPGNATVTVRDALYVYEMQVREGRLRCATRTGADGEFARGPRALSGLLGVGSGRFVVTPASSSCRADFEGELEEVLADPIRTARAAVWAVTANAIPDVAQLQFDVEAIGAYTTVLPDPARALAQRLMEGASPRDLLLRERVDLHLLEALLVDLARHGGIRAVRAADGRDLLPTFNVEGGQRPEQPAVPVEILTPSPMFVFRLTPPAKGHGVAERGEAGAGWEEASLHADSQPPPREGVPPVAPNEPGERISLLDGAWDAIAPRAPGFGGEPERLTLPGVGRRTAADAVRATSTTPLGMGPASAERAAAEAAAPAAEQPAAEAEAEAAEADKRKAEAEAPVAKAAAPAAEERAAEAEAGEADKRKAEAEAPAAQEPATQAEAAAAEADKRKVEALASAEPARAEEAAPAAEEPAAAAEALAAEAEAEAPAVEEPAAEAEAPAAEADARKEGALASADADAAAQPHDSAAIRGEATLPERPDTPPEPSAGEPFLPSDPRPVSTAAAAAAELLTALADGHAFCSDSALNPEQHQDFEQKGPSDEGEARAGERGHRRDHVPDTVLASGPVVVRRLARPPRPAADRRYRPGQGSSSQGDVDSTPTAEPQDSGLADKAAADSGIVPPPTRASGPLPPVEPGSDSESLPPPTRASEPSPPMQSQPPLPVREIAGRDMLARTVPGQVEPAQGGPDDTHEDDEGAAGDAPGRPHKAKLASTLVSDAPPPLADTDVKQDLSGTLVSGVTSPGPLPVQKRVVFPKREAGPPTDESGAKAGPPTDEVAADAALDHEAAREPGAEGGDGTESPAPLPDARRIAFPKRQSPAATVDSTDSLEVGKHEEAPREERLPAKPTAAASAAGKPGALGALKTFGVTLAAAAISYGAVSLVRTWMAPAPSPVSTAAPAAASASAARNAEMAAPAAPAPAASSASTPAESEAVQIEDGPLPPGIAVADDKGLLEVVTNSRESIYVGGAFVGRGPIRRVELGAGPHQVRIREGAEEREFTVNIQKGRRARLGLAPAD